MAVAWEFVARLTRTRLGRVEREYLLKNFGKVIRRQWKLAVAIAEGETKRLSTLAILVADALIKRAAQIYPRFAKKYPFVAKFTQLEWTEAVARLINRGEKENLRGIRGVIVERFIPTMKQMEKLYADMVKLAKANGWKEPALVSGVRTINGKELADWMIVAEHKDGRVWIMAIVESKSVSNTKDLVLHGEKPVGQHLWDIWRAKKDGIKIERLEKGGLTTMSYPPNKIVAGVSAPGTQLKETTRLIGVTPRDFTVGEFNKLAVKGVNVERWAWPVDEDELFRMLKELMGALSE
jgi:hypothetical protein